MEEELSSEMVAQFRQNYDEAAQVYTITGGFLRKTGDNRLEIVSLWVHHFPSKQDTEPTAVFQTENERGQLKMGGGSSISSGIFINVSRSANYTASISTSDDGKKSLHVTDFLRPFWSANLYLDEIGHDEPHFFGEFGNCAWDEKNLQIAYTAEPKFGETIKKPGKYVEQVHWGEECQMVYSPIICIWSISEGINGANNVRIFQKTFERSVTPHKIVWNPSGTCLLFFALDNEKRMGKLLCNNRSGKLLVFNIKSNNLFDVLQNDDDICKKNFDCYESLSFSPDGQWLIFFARKCDGPHNSSVALCKVQWNVNAAARYSSIVINQKQNDEDEFPGLFNVVLPARAWIGENTVVFQSTIKCRTMILLANISTNAFTIIENSPSMKQHLGSFKLLDVFQNNILAAYSTLNEPEQLMLAKNCRSFENPNDPVISIDWTTSKLQNKEFAWTYTREMTNGIEILLIQPNKSNGALIVYPHGGPHSASVDSWPEPHVQMFAMSGYGIMFINYTGSAGYGESFLRALLGDRGKIEVDDVQNAVEYVADKYNYNTFFALGASYGGFIALHLVARGQQPKLNYAACAAINPILDLSTIVQLTDITDNPLCVGIGRAQFEKALSADEYRQLYNQSPLSKSEEIFAPVLLAVGEHDYRVVPHYKNVSLHLQRRNIQHKVLSYPCGHSITGLERELNLWMNIVSWFECARNKM